MLRVLSNLLVRHWLFAVFAMGARMDGGFQVISVTVIMDM